MALVHVREQGDRRAAGEVGREPARELPARRSTAATTSPTSRSPASATARSPALRVKTYANLGGRLSTIGPGIPTTLYGRVLSGCYKIPNVYCRGHRRLHEHDVRRRLPRRRPARGDLRHRAGDGPLRQRDRDGPGGDPAQELHPARPVPVREPVRPRDRVSGGAKIYIDSGNYEPALDKALTTAGYDDLDARRRPRRRAAASSSGMGLSTYIEVCGVAPVEVDRRRRRGLGRGDVGVGQHQGPPDRQGRRHDGHPAAGPGPRDDLRPGRRPRARHPDGRHRRPALRHAGHAVRLRLVRQPDVVGRHDGGDQGRRQDQGQGPPLRRPHARGVARRHRGRRRRVPGQGLARQEEDDPGDRLRARPRRSTLPDGHGAVPRRDRLLRHAELHVAVRDAHRDRRDRRGDRRGRPRRATSPSTTSARRSTR